MSNQVTASIPSNYDPNPRESREEAVTTPIDSAQDINLNGNMPFYPKPNKYPKLGENDVPLASMCDE